MADTLRLTQQCPSGGCYTITDRGTLQQLIANGAITALPIAMEQQDAAARGGSALMVNQYRGYALDPGQGPGRQDRGRPRVPGLPHRRAASRIASSASRRRAQPGFFPAAFPAVSLTRRPPRAISARRTLTVRGTIASAVPVRARSTARRSASRASRRRSPPGRSTRRRPARRRVPASLEARPQRPAVPHHDAVPRSQPAAPRARRGCASAPRSGCASRACAAARSCSSGRAWPATGRRRARLVVLARPAAGGRVPGVSGACGWAAAATASCSAPGSPRAAGTCGCATSIAASWRRDDPPGGPCSSADRDGGVARRRRARGARGARRGRRRTAVRPRGRGSTRTRCATPPTFPRAPTRCAHRPASATPSRTRPPSRCHGCSSSPACRRTALSFVSIRRPNGTLSRAAGGRPGPSRSVSRGSAARLARRRQRAVPPARPRRCRRERRRQHRDRRRGPRRARAARAAARGRAPRRARRPARRRASAPGGAGHRRAARRRAWLSAGASATATGGDRPGRLASLAPARRLRRRRAAPTATTTRAAPRSRSWSGSARRASAAAGPVAETAIRERSPVTGPTEPPEDAGAAAPAATAPAARRRPPPAPAPDARRRSGSRRRVRSRVRRARKRRARTRRDAAPPGAVPVRGVLVAATIPAATAAGRPARHSRPPHAGRREGSRGRDAAGRGGRHRLLAARARRLARATPEAAMKRRGDHLRPRRAAAGAGADPRARRARARAGRGRARSRWSSCAAGAATRRAWSRPPSAPARRSQAATSAPRRACSGRSPGATRWPPRSRCIAARARGERAEDRIAKALADFDYASLRRLERTRLLVRAGPALGLMGTLIPLSPGARRARRGRRRRAEQQPPARLQHHGARPADRRCSRSASRSCATGSTGRTSPTSSSSPPRCGRAHEQPRPPARARPRRPRRRPARRARQPLRPRRRAGRRVPARRARVARPHRRADPQRCHRGALRAGRADDHHQARREAPARCACSPASRSPGRAAGRQRLPAPDGASSTPRAAEWSSSGTACARPSICCSAATTRSSTSSRVTLRMAFWSTLLALAAGLPLGLAARARPVPRPRQRAGARQRRHGPAARHRRTGRRAAAVPRRAARRARPALHARTA